MFTTIPNNTLHTEIRYIRSLGSTNYIPVRTYHDLEDEAETSACLRHVDET